MLRDTRLPESVDKDDLRRNDLSSRIPKFPFHKDLEPKLMPKADTPRVSKSLTFAELVRRLEESKGPEIVYMAESHRLYFIVCFAFTFISAYNLFDMIDTVFPLAIQSFENNDLQGTPMENFGQLVRRFGLMGLLCAVYLGTGLFFAGFPSRLVRRIEYVPGTPQLVRLVTHPWIPGRPSPVVTIPLNRLSIGKRSKVWTGEGFYGAASKTSFFFFIWEKDHRIPWVVDRSGWFWGDARVYDVLFGKEPVALAEKGMSYDDMLRRQAELAEQKKAELRRQLGPAWQLKAMGKLMAEDIKKFNSASRRAVFALRNLKKDTKPLPESTMQGADKKLKDSHEKDH